MKLSKQVDLYFQPHFGCQTLNKHLMMMSFHNIGKHNILLVMVPAETFLLNPFIEQQERTFKGFLLTRKL